MNRKNHILACLLLLLSFQYAAFSQQIAIDRGVRLDGLWCFPLVTDSLQYMYLPDQSQLALDNQNHPQFSFVRYVSSILESVDSGSNSIRQAKGGGILHFLVTYDTDPKKVKNAQSKLRELLGSDSVKLRGPIVFKEGRFALVSSILNSENGKTEKSLLAVGQAPVLEGSRIALSFELDPQRSKLLLESFKMSTPDVSLIFDLTFAGLTDAYNAKLTVDWTEVSKYEKISAGVKIYFVSADIEKTYAELRRTNAIKLESSGADSRMDALVNTAYNKLTDLIFQRIDPEQGLAAQANPMNNMLGGMLGNSSSGNIFPFGAHAEYKVKDIKTSGSSVLYFNSRISSDRHHYIAFNIGDMYKKYGTNTDYFKTISLSDPDFEQRDISVAVDGQLLPEFDKLINSVTVTLKKEHTNGSTTVREVNINKAVAYDTKPVSMSYGSVGDTNKLEWLNYEYKAQYQFKGGKNYEASWQKQSNSMINLFAPYERRTIKFEGDSKLLKDKNVRVIIIKVNYPFFGEDRRLETYLKPDDNFPDKQFDITLPANQYSYHYTLIWRFKNGTEKTITGLNDTEILFIDTIPD